MHPLYSNWIISNFSYRREKYSQDTFLYKTLDMSIAVIPGNIFVS
jgi:hypothetical protein